MTRPAAMVRAVRAATAVTAVVLAVSMLVACASDTRKSRPPAVTVGDAEVGRELIGTYGCGSCHTIPGVRGAKGLVGPPLSNFADRGFIAGQLANNQDNLIRWIMDPQGVEPGTAMPDLGVSRNDAENIAAYLLGLG